MKLFFLKLRRFWASLQRDHQLALKLCFRIKQEVDHFVTIETSAIENEINILRSKLQQDATTLADAQSRLAAIQNVSAEDQAKVDAIAAELHAINNPPAA